MLMSSPFIKMSGAAMLLVLDVKYMQTALPPLRVNKHEFVSQSDTLHKAAVSLAAACSFHLAWVKMTASSAYI